MGLGNSGAGGVAGFTGVSDGAGFTGAAPVAGSGATPGGGGLGAILKILQDPQVIMALGQFGKDMGKSIQSAGKLPPELQQLFQQAVAHNMGGSQQVNIPPPSGPYMGDIGAFLGPTLARNALREFGIPTGGH